MNQIKIGKFIASLRKEHNMTQDELGAKLSIVRENVSKWERGINMPTPDSLLAMSEIFGVSINELLLGERKNSENSKELDNISLEVLKESRKKLKKTITYFAILVFAMLFVFLSYYFVNTYNTIKVYKVTGTGTEFSSLDGLVLVSKQKSYIKLGKVISENNYEYEKVELYFMDKNNNKKIIYTSNSIEDSLSSYYGYDEYFKYNEVDNVINNLYLRIIYDNNEETIKLEAKRDMINNNIINNQDKDAIDDDYNNDDTDVIPKYIKDNFEYNQDEDYYILKYTENKINYEIRYEGSTQYLNILETNKDGSIKFYEYSNNKKRLTFYTIGKDKNMSNEYMINLKTNECILGDCDKNIEITNYFQENYYKKYFEDTSK